jgi:hypothetical protein
MSPRRQSSGEVLRKLTSESGAMMKKIRLRAMVGIALVGSILFAVTARIDVRAEDVPVPVGFQ